MVKDKNNLLTRTKWGESYDDKLEEIEDVSNRLKKLFPDVYRIILGFLEPNIFHVVLDLSNDMKIIQDNFKRACWIGDVEMAQSMFHKGATFRANDKFLFMRAICGGHLDIVKFLFLHGINFKAYKNDALIKASSRGHLEVVKFLAKHNTNVRAYYELPLSFASKGGHLEVVKFLVSKGASIEWSDAKEIASRNNHKEVVAFLVAHKAKCKTCCVL